MDYRVHRKYVLWGPRTVEFHCGGCGAALESPLEAAGTVRDCPYCQQVILIPGVDELEKVQAQAEADEAKAVAAAKAARERATIDALEAEKVKPPELVWYGEMVCNSCGYGWISRRDTPPARCHACGSRYIRAIQRPRTTYPGAWIIVGCIVFILAIIFCAISSAVQQ